MTPTIPTIPTNPADTLELMAAEALEKTGGGAEVVAVACRVEAEVVEERDNPEYAEAVYADRSAPP